MDPKLVHNQVCFGHSVNVQSCDKCTFLWTSIERPMDSIWISYRRPNVKSGCPKVLTTSLRYLGIYSTR